MLTIIFPDKAKETYRVILEQFYRNSTDAALKLDEKVENYFERLKVLPQSCPPVPDFPQFRRCVVHKKVSLVYRLVSEQRIEIVGFFHNRMDWGFLGNK